MKEKTNKSWVCSCNVLHLTGTKCGQCRDYAPGCEPEEEENMPHHAQREDLINRMRDHKGPGEY